MADKVTKSDPENYRSLSEPFRSKDAAQTATEAFFEDVATARKKHGITDVHIITKIAIAMEDGERGAFWSAHLGDPIQAVEMCAYALGQEKEWLNNLVGRYVK